MTHLSETSVCSAVVQLSSARAETPPTPMPRDLSWEDKLPLEYAEIVCVRKRHRKGRVLKRREVCERKGVFTFGAETQNLTPAKAESSGWT